MENKGLLGRIEKGVRKLKVSVAYTLACYFAKPQVHVLPVINPITMYSEDKVFNPSEDQTPVREAHSNDPHYDDGTSLVSLNEESVRIDELIGELGPTGYITGVNRRGPLSRLGSEGDGYYFTGRIHLGDGENLINPNLKLYPNSSGFEPSDYASLIHEFGHASATPEHIGDILNVVYPVEGLGSQEPNIEQPEIRVLRQDEVVVTDNSDLYGPKNEPVIQADLPPVIPVGELEKMIKNFQGYPEKSPLNPPVHLPVDEEQSYGPKPQPNPIIDLNIDNSINLPETILNEKIYHSHLEDSLKNVKLDSNPEEPKKE